MKIQLIRYDYNNFNYSEKQILTATLIFWKQIEQFAVCIFIFSDFDVELIIRTYLKCRCWHILLLVFRLLYPKCKCCTGDGCHDKFKQFKD